MQILERQESAAHIWPLDSPAVIEAKRVCKNWKEWQGNMTNWANPPALPGKPGCDEKDPEMCFQDDSGV